MNRGGYISKTTKVILYRSDSVNLLTMQKRSHESTESDGYMGLIQNFQQAFDELQAEDNHPKRIGKRDSTA